MPKYSPDSSGSSQENSDGDVCELCGTDAESLTTAVVAGAEVTVCHACRPSDADNPDSSSESGSTETNESVESETTGYTITNPDSSWAEENPPEYGNAETPYLKPDYAETVVDARERADLSQQELADRAAVPTESVRSVENGDAIRDDVGKAVIDALEETLEIDIQETT